MPPKPVSYLSMAEAAARLGLDGDGPRRLKNQLLARERVTGETILIRLHEGKRTVYRVTIPLLRRYCPELFDRRDEVAEELRERFNAIEEKLEELWARDEAMVKAIREQNKAIQELRRPLAA